jgi:hypothetical protein
MLEENCIKSEGPMGDLVANASQIMGGGFSLNTEGAGKANKRGGRGVKRRE